MACPGKHASATLGMPIKMILSFVNLTVPNQLRSFFATGLETGHSLRAQFLPDLDKRPAKP